MFSTFKSLVGVSPCEIAKKKNGTIEKGRFNHSKHLIFNRLNGQCLVYSRKQNVILAERDRLLCLSQHEPGWAAIVVYARPVQWPLCSGSCFYWGSKNITNTPTINTLLRMWGHSNVTSQGAGSLESLDNQQTGVVGAWILGRGLEEEVWPTRTPGSTMSLSWCLSYCWWVCIAIISQTFWLKRSNLCSYSSELINCEMGQNEAV